MWKGMPQTRKDIIRRVFGNRKSFTKQAATDILRDLKEPWLTDEYKPLVAKAKRGELSREEFSELEMARDFDFIRVTIRSTARAVLRGPTKPRKTTRNAKRNPK